MSIAPLPAPLEPIAGRRFAFYPPIGGISPNEWLYRRTTWPECVVTHIASGAEYPIPRMFLGGVSVSEYSGSAPATVVELTGELELRSGAIRPSRPRVIELPITVADDEATTQPGGRKANVVSIRLDAEPETGSEPARSAAKIIGAAMVLGVVAFTIVVDIARQMNKTPDSGVAARAWQRLTPDDDYRSVLAKLGPPARERSFEESGRAVRVMLYPTMRFSVVLSGSSRTGERYAETLDMRGRPLDFSALSHSGTDRR